MKTQWLEVLAAALTTALPLLVAFLRALLRARAAERKAGELDEIARAVIEGVEAGADPTTKRACRLASERRCVPGALAAAVKAATAGPPGGAP